MLAAVAMELGAWLVAAAAFVGLGCLVLPKSGHPKLGDCFWTGFGFVVCFLQLWHFAWAVDGVAWAALGPLAALGFARQRPQVARDAFRPAAIAAVIVAVAGTAVLALSADRNGDGCLYFLQTERWVGQLPVVPGLGNLHHRLAFNHSYFLYAALLDVEPFWHRAEHLANGLLLLGVALPGIVAAVRLFRSPASHAADLLRVTVLALSVRQAVGPNLSSLAPDIAVWALGAVVVIALAEALFETPGAGAGRLVWVVALSAVGVVVKASFMTVGAPAIVLAAWTLWRLRLPASELWKAAACATALASVAIVPWMIHGTIQSGYPLFPSTFLNLRLPWRVPEAIARGEVSYIRAFARYQTVTASDGWISSWLEHVWLDDYDFTAPLAVLLVAGAALIVVSVRNRERKVEVPLIAMLCASVAMWFGLAPDPRFLGPTLWLLNATVGIALWRASSGRARLPWIAAWAALVVAGFAGQPLPKGLSGFEPAPSDRSVAVRLASGDLVHESRGCCVEIPCGISVNNLQLRRPGDLGGGFTSVLTAESVSR